MNHCFAEHGRCLVLVGLCVATMCCAARSPAGGKSASDLAGIYACKGTTTDGTAYRAVVEIAAYGDVWALRWVFENKKQGQGFGILEGDVLSVLFEVDGGVGWAAYRLRTDGGAALRLVGRWTAPGVEPLATETLTRTTGRPVDAIRGRGRGA